MINTRQVHALLEQLKRVCVFDGNTDCFSHAGRQFSLVLREAEKRIWIEVRIELIALGESDAVEMMATALATNSSVLNTLPMPASLGLLDNPIRFVCLIRLEGQCPSAHELLVLLEQLAAYSPVPI